MKPYKLEIDNALKERVNNIKKKIDQETDQKRKLKLKEQMIMADLFSFNGGGYTKYKNPW
jgi:regulator of sirC expression with transglutaminase-like and TPR domain